MPGEHRYQMCSSTNWSKSVFFVGALAEVLKFLVKMVLDVFGMTKF